MTVATIIVSDPTNPQEMLTWLASNPGVEILTVLVSQNIFYVFY